MITWYQGHSGYWAKVNNKWYYIIIQGPYMGNDLVVSVSLWKEWTDPPKLTLVDTKYTSWMANNMMDFFNYNPGYLFDPLWDGRIM